ncbi:MAG: type I methionyl aminopeptidase [Phycisphaeraceae bacterium]|nr:type I methionyl aminopeptidase [Phycisphaeraceae bacterium]MCW5755314.1 type I methionyl aminopeptidase [Phycisphaeraceae bacterium]
MTPIGKLSPADTDAAYAAAQIVVEVHRRLSTWLAPGQTLVQIDAFVASNLETLKARSCFLGYRAGGSPAFPSHACLSVNDCVVHGTATSHSPPLQPGDVLKIDIGVTYKGWIGDAAWTYVFGTPSSEVAKLCAVGKESLRRGIEQLRPGNRYLEWARAVQGYVEGEHKLHLIRGLGGHGYGRKLHAPPFISNTMPTYYDEWPDGALPCRPGTLLAVEPMLALGTGATRQKRNTWPVYTADGSMSAHYEHDVLITDSGPRILTEGLDDIRDVIA